MAEAVDANKIMDETLETWHKQQNHIVKPDLIKVSEEFHFNGKGIWLGLERTSNPSEGLVSQYVKAHEDLVSAFKAISGQTMTDFNSGIPSTPPIIDYKAKERVEILVDKAETPDELISYWRNALDHGLEDHYNNRLKELTK